PSLHLTVVDVFAEAVPARRKRLRRPTIIGHDRIRHLRAPSPMVYAVGCFVHLASDRCSNRKRVGESTRCSRVGTAPLGPASRRAPKGRAHDGLLLLASGYRSCRARTIWTRWASGRGRRRDLVDERIASREAAKVGVLMGS